MSCAYGQYAFGDVFAWQFAVVVMEVGVAYSPKLRVHKDHVTLDLGFQDLYRLVSLLSTSASSAHSGSIHWTWCIDLRNRLIVAMEAVDTMVKRSKASKDVFNTVA